MTITAGEKKKAEDCEICGSRQEVSKKYLMVEFHLIWFWIIFDTYESHRRHRERVVQILRKKRMSIWREGVRQVTNTVRRDIGAQSDNYGRQYKRS